MREIEETELQRRAIDGRLLDVRTSIAAEIRSFDANTMRATVRAAVRVQIVDADSPPQVLTLPDIPDVPVQFPHFGACILYHPLTAGDVGRLEFSEEDDLRVYLDAGVTLPINPENLQRHGASCVFRPEGFRGVGGLGGESASRGFLGTPGGVGISWADDLRLGGSGASDPVVRKSDLQAALDAAVNGHSHTVPAGTDAAGGFTGTGPSHTATGSATVKSV